MDGGTSNRLVSITVLLSVYTGNNNRSKRPPGRACFLFLGTESEKVRSGGVYSSVVPHDTGRLPRYGAFSGKKFSGAGGQYPPGRTRTKIKIPVSYGGNL